MGKNIRYIMLRTLEQKIRLGTSKRAAKQKNNGNSPYIHAAGTARSYMGIAARYGNWLRDIGLNKCTWEDAREHAAEFVQAQKSVYTKHTVRSALAKVFGCHGPDICQLPPRRAKDIKKGRELSARAAAVEHNHPDLAEVCRSMGLRCNRELANIEAKNFFYEDGALYVRVRGKGGRWRDAKVIDGRGRELIERAIVAHPKGSLFVVPSGANVQRWRADYAARCYIYAMEHGMGSGQMYHCRDGSGRCYDKHALDWCSVQLGHGPRRYYTIVHNYLSYGDAGR